MPNASGAGRTDPRTGSTNSRPREQHRCKRLPLPFTGVTPITENTPNTLTVGGVIDGAGFAAVMTAINNLQGVSLLSAPSVTTQSGLKANIDIVREFPYPTSFEKPKLSSNSNLAYSSGPGANLIPDPWSLA